MNQFLLNQKSPFELTKLIAKRIKEKRKKLKISQIELAKKSDVSLGSIKRFENKYEISFVSLVKIAVVLGLGSDLEELFKQKTYSSIDEVING